MARRSGGWRGIGLPGDDSGTHGRKNRGITRTRWQFTPLLTAPPRDGGGGFEEVVEVCHGEPGEGEGGSLIGNLIAAVQGTGFGVLNAGDDWSSTDCGEHGVDPPHSAPQEIGQKWGGVKIPILLFPSGSARSSETGVGGAGWEAHGGAHVPILVCFPPGQ